MRLVSLAFLLTAVSFFSGCAKVMNVGDPNFSCEYKGDNGYSCMKPSEVYQKILDKDITVEQKQQYINMLKVDCENLNFENMVKNICGDKPFYEEKKIKEYEECRSEVLKDYRENVNICNKVETITPQIKSVQQVRDVGGLPIRTDKKVYRMWVAPYVDNKGRLNLSNYVFMDMGEREWIYDTADIRESGGLESVLLNKIEQGEQATTDTNTINSNDFYDKDLSSQKTNTNNVFGVPKK